MQVRPIFRVNWTIHFSLQKTLLHLISFATKLLKSFVHKQSITFNRIAIKSGANRLAKQLVFRKQVNIQVDFTSFEGYGSVINVATGYPSGTPYRI